MKLDDTKLTGWLVMMRHSQRVGAMSACPKFVTEQLIERGWMAARKVYVLELKREIECLEITEKGLAHADLEAAEWGCDALEYAQ